MAGETGPAHDAIREATRKFANGAMLYLALAAVSLLNIFRNFGAAGTVEISYYVIRSSEACLMFPLALWWIRGERELRQTYWTIIAFVMGFSLINTIQVLGMGSPRAGITWVASRPTWPTEGPNEAGAALVVAWALLMAEHMLRPRWYNIVMFVVILILEVWTQSRSGLLALLTFNLLMVRRIPTRYLVLAVILGAITLPLAPHSWWDRMTKTASMQRGSVELFSWLMRVFAYITAFKVLTASWQHWVFGLGYMGFRFVSDQYNTLHYKIGQCENWWLETWVGLGIFGVYACTRWFIRFWKLGLAVKRVTRPGTFGYMLADMHVPLVISLGVVNLTGANFVGLVGISQIAVWSAMVVRGGHIFARDPQAT